MKKALVLLMAVLFFSIAGCQKKTANADKTALQTNDIVTELIKENILASSTNTNDIATNGNILEPINQPVPINDKALAETGKSALPVEPEVGKSKPVAALDKTIKDRPLAPVKTEKAVSVSGGSFVKIGNDASGQSTSPRNAIKITSAMLSAGKGSRYADFYVYAVPRGAEKKLTSDYLIVLAKNIEIINGQAQFTRWWNGKNINGDFLSAGNYNIYLVFSVKDKDMNVLKKEDRYWGSDKYFIKLY